MLTGKKYEDVIANVSASLKEKIEHSVSLLRKAEKLALIYDNTNGFMLAFSGGKDSQALFHIAELAGVKFKAHMNLTSVDPPEVIRFVKQYYPEVYLAKPYDSIFNIAVKKGILPTMRVRFCCKELKESTGAGKVTLIGIRHAESIRRAKRNEVEISSHKYSGTLDGLDEYRRKKRGPGRPRKNPKPEPFNINTVKGESQAGCISGKESLLISPIIHWEERDVWDFLDIMGVPHCSLYDEGWKRLGCIGCPMSSPKMKLRENERWPHVRRNWIKAIIRIRRGGVSPEERTNHKTNLGIWTGDFLENSGGAEPMFRIPVQWMRDGRNWQRAIYGGESGRTTQQIGSITQGTEGRCSEGISPIAEAGLRGHLRGRYGMGFYNKPIGGGTNNQLVSNEKPEQKGSAGSETLRPQAENEGTAVPHKRTDIPDWCTEEEWLIAENIYDWWISQKSYRQWYSEKFEQKKLDFND